MLPVTHSALAGTQSPANFSSPDPTERARPASFAGAWASCLSPGLRVKDLQRRLRRRS
jgi:hypothetical protein